jgi:hypothetical protein
MLDFKIYFQLKNFKRIMKKKIYMYLYIYSKMDSIPVLNKIVIKKVRSN